MQFKVGDRVVRYFGGSLLPLQINEARDGSVFCGDLEFDAETGREINNLLGWGPGGSGSFIVLDLSAAVLEARAVIEELVHALRLLIDCQNGPPLPRTRELWEDAMSCAGGAMLLNEIYQAGFKKKENEDA